MAAAALAIGGATVPAHAQSKPDDQEQARQEMRAGNVLTSRTIENRVVPGYLRKGYDYLNFEYDGNAGIYRLKFIKSGRVLFVDVNARTGRVVRRQR